METASDYEELFKILNACRIKYLVVGAHAVSYYAEPRFTKDLDVWIGPEINDPNRVFAALRQFGAPLSGMSPADFQDRKMILQIGVAPVRIDILMKVPGVSFLSAWRNRKKVRYGRTAIHVMGLTDLIKAKEKAGRPQDLLDLSKLRVYRQKKRTRRI